MAAGLAQGHEPGTLQEEFQCPWRDQSCPSPWPAHPTVERLDAETDRVKHVEIIRQGLDSRVGGTVPLRGRDRAP